MSVFVLARGWIVTTAEDTRLNTPTIVTIERERERECFNFMGNIRDDITLRVLRPEASDRSLCLG